MNSPTEGRQWRIYYCPQLDKDIKEDDCAYNCMTAFFIKPEYAGIPEMRDIPGWRDRCEVCPRNLVIFDRMPEEEVERIIRETFPKNQKT